MFSAPAIGDHVKARRDLRAGFVDGLTGATSVPKGRRGIVRARRRGLMTERYVVEFDDGWTTRTVDVRPRDVRRAALGTGERSWTLHRDVKVGMRLGLFLAFTLPALVGVGLYFLHGGTTSGLVGALINEVVSLLGSIVGAIGLVGTLVGVFVLVALAKRRAR